MTSVLLITWQAAHFDFMRIWFINRTTHRVVKSSREREFPRIFIESAYVHPFQGGDRDRALSGPYPLYILDILDILVCDWANNACEEVKNGGWVDDAGRARYVAWIARKYYGYVGTLQSDKWM
jgi:hypothetical protein